MKDLDKLKAFVNKQIQDPKIWDVVVKTEREDYLQLQVRRLHAAIEVYALGENDPMNWYFINNE